MSRTPVRRDTRQHARSRLEVPVMVSDASKKGQRPILFASADVSGGGAFLRADLLFEVGEVLQVEFDLPGGRHINVQGRVVRVARGGHKDKYAGMGLEFLDLSPADLAAIEGRLS